MSPALHRAFRDSDVAADWKSSPGPRWWAYQTWMVTRQLGLGMVYDHVRRRAAAAGLEARHPLVDVDVIELVLALPPQLAYDTRFSRPLVREAMEGLVPDEVRLRPSKSTFDALFHDAMAGPDLAVARAVLEPGRAEVGAYVDLDLVGRRLLASPPPPGERLQWALELWRLLTAECWLRLAAGGSGAAAPWPASAPPALELQEKRRSR